MKARPSSARPANRPRHFDISSDPERVLQGSINELLPSSVPLNSASSSSLPVNTTNDADHATKSPPQSIRLVTGHTITASARQRPRPQSAKGSRPTCCAPACPPHLAQHPPPLLTLQSPLPRQGTTRLCSLVQPPPCILFSDGGRLTALRLQGRPSRLGKSRLQIRFTRPSQRESWVSGERR
jgi:hypothetical protein